MKLKFDPSLEYQRDAINAAVSVFESQSIMQSDFEISGKVSDGIAFSELGVGNQVMFDDEQLLENIQKIQEKNNIEKIERLEGHEFSIEMETGTGKTYVYLRTIFELAKNYGLKKFVIVVPSVAVREGVLKSIDMTKKHFLALYDNQPFNHFVYDSKKLGAVRQFATANQIQIMVINIQSFSKDVADSDTSEMTEDELKKLNIINRENDKMSGYKPIEFIQATNPIVIIDEPQSVDNTEKAKCAIARLHPAVTLRYSATHKNFYNLLYKLDPVRAYDLKLVKRIEVASVLSDDNFNAAYVKLIKTYHQSGIKAQVEIHKKTNGRVKPIKVTVKLGDDLFIKSGERENYRDGYIINNIDRTPGAENIKFNNGSYLELGQGIGDLKDDIMKEQINETVKQHLEKERLLSGEGIKVLSLFFIDRVANYRVYNDDGTASLGKIGKWFEEAYKKFTTSEQRYKKFAEADISQIHNGYFSQDNKGRAKDTKGKSEADGDTYNLIMRDKERLLDPDEPLRFIFSHSALREGWDNPNVFQICTLNETWSIQKKRQEIGRGLRLPVNKYGERVRSETINRLTVVANESYEDFAQSLQSEFEEDFGIRFGHVTNIAFAKIVRIQDNGEEVPIGQEESAKIWQQLIDAGYINNNGDILDEFDPKNPHFELNIDEQYDDVKYAITDVIKGFVFENRVVNARKRQTLQFNKQVYLSPEFSALWDKIKHRTRYRVAFETDDLIKRAVERIREIEPIKAIRIETIRVNVDISKAGVSADEISENREIYTSRGINILPDLLAYLQKETELTRHTLVAILKQSDRLLDFQSNPQKFMTLVAREISRALRDLILEGIQYEKIANHYWEMSRIEQEAEEGIVRYLNNLYKVNNKEKCLFDAIEFDSEVEKQFAKDLDSNERIRLFVKLPSWFKIDTPVGPYNPDWAFLTEREEKLYFVQETKGTQDSEELRHKENRKIDCGKKHFRTIGVDYGVVTKLADVGF